MAELTPEARALLQSLMGNKPVDYVAPSGGTPGMSVYASPIPPGPGPSVTGLPQIGHIPTDAESARMVQSLSGAISGPSMQLIQLLKNYTQQMALGGISPLAPGPGKSSSNPYLFGEPSGPSGLLQYGPDIPPGPTGPLLVYRSKPYGWGQSRFGEPPINPVRTGSVSGTLFEGQAAGGGATTSAGGVLLPPRPPGGFGPPPPPPIDFNQYDEPIGPEIGGSSPISSTFLERLGGRVGPGRIQDSLARINYQQKVRAIQASGGDASNLMPPGYEDVEIRSGGGFNKPGAKFSNLTETVRVPSGAADELRAQGRVGLGGYSTSKTQLDEIIGRNKPPAQGLIASAGESFLSTFMDPQRLGAHIGYIGQAIVVWTAFRTAVELARGAMDGFVRATMTTNDALARTRIVMSAPGQQALGGVGNAPNALFGIAGAMANFGVGPEEALKLAPQILAMSGGLGGGGYQDLAASTGYMNAIFGIQPAEVSRSLQRTSTILGRTPTQISNLATAAYRNAGVPPEEFLNSLSAIGAEATLSQTSPEKVGGLVAGLSLMSHTTPNEAGNLLFTLQRAIATPQGGGTLARYGINTRNIDQGTGLATPASILDILPQFSQQYSGLPESGRLDILASLGLREKRKDVEVILGHYQELSQLQEKIAKDANAQSDAMREMRFNLGYQTQRAGAQVGAQFSQAVSQVTSGPLSAVAGGLSVFNDIYKAIVDTKTILEKVPAGIVGGLAGLLGLNKGGESNDIWAAFTKAVKGDPSDLIRLGIGKADFGDLGNKARDVLNNPFGFLNNPIGTLTNPSRATIDAAYQEYRTGERSAAGGDIARPAVGYGGFMPFGQYQLMAQYKSVAEKFLIDAGIGIKPTPQAFGVFGGPGGGGPLAVKVDNWDENAKAIAQELASRRLTGVINLPNLAEMSVSAAVQQKIFSLYGSSSSDLFLNGQTGLMAGAKETGSANSDLVTSFGGVGDALNRLQNQLDSLSGSISKLAQEAGMTSNGTQDFGTAPEFEQNPGIFGAGGGVYMDGNLVGKALAGYGKAALDASLKSNYSAGTGNAPVFGSPVP